MSEQGLKRLVGAVALLGGLWLISALLSGQGRGGVTASGQMFALFRQLEGPSLTGVTVESSGDTLVLVREGETWTVNGHATDDLTLSTFLVAVTSASVGDLVATNPENHERMGVTDEVATRVDFETDSGRSSFLLGRSGRAFQTAYVRLPGEDEVYVMHGDLSSQLRRPVDSWRDRTIVAVDTAAVARLVVESGDGDYVLQRADSVWTLEDGSATDGPTVSAILTELASLSATGFLTEVDSIAALDRASITRAFASDGSLLAEVTVGEGNADRWARAGDGGSIFRLSAFRAGRVAPARSTVAGGGG